MSVVSNAHAGGGVVIYLLMLAMAAVLVFAFTNQYAFEWWARRKRAIKGAQSHAQRLVDKHVGPSGAEAELRTRLTAAELSLNERKHLEATLRLVRSGKLTARVSEIEISKPGHAA
jgi:hypothetical protein